MFAFKLGIRLCALAAASISGVGPVIAEADVKWDSLCVSISAEGIAKIDISITPDGVGLPVGSGTVAQGEAIFGNKCAACHGEAGASGEGLADSLVGGIGTLASDSPVKTVGSFWPYATTLYDYTRRAMPMYAPLSLSNDEVYAVTAYILFLNDIIDEDTMMDQATLKDVEMPNRAGFLSDWPDNEH